MTPAKLDRFVAVTDLGLLSLSTALSGLLSHCLNGSLTWCSPIPFRASVTWRIHRMAGSGSGLPRRIWICTCRPCIATLPGHQGQSSLVDPYAKAAAKWVDPDVGLRYTKLAQAIDVGELLAGITQPTLVLLRSEQNIVPARACQRVAAAIPGPQFRQYSDPNFVRWPELIRDFAGQATPTHAGRGDCIRHRRDPVHRHRRFDCADRADGRRAFPRLIPRAGRGPPAAIRDAGGARSRGSCSVTVCWPVRVGGAGDRRGARAWSCRGVELGMVIGLHAGDVIREEDGQRVRGR